MLRVKGLRGGEGWAVLSAVVLGVVGAVVLVGSGLRPQELRTELVEEVPTAVTDLEAKVDVEGKKAWMKQIFDSAASKTALHPLSNIDPFTGQPAEDDYESHLRAEATKAVADKIQKEADTEINDAQQVARDYAGSDAGCTHKLLNQTDYAGDVAQTVTNDDCLPWAEAETMGLTAVYTAAAYPELTGNACRNPGAARLGSWCYKATAVAEDPTDAEGVNWAFCDIGSRCGIDMPLLKPVKGAKGAVLKNPQPDHTGATNTNVLRQKKLQILAKRTHGVAPSHMLHHKLARKTHLGPAHSLAQHRQLARPTKPVTGHALAAHQQMARHTKPVSGHTLTPHQQTARRNKPSKGRTMHQQLAWLSFAQEQPGQPYSWDDGISGKVARKQLKHRDWFLLDKHMARVRDSGIDAGMSDDDSRKALEDIFKD